MKCLFSLVVILLLVSCKQPKTSMYKVDESSSRLEWKGSAPDHFHVGSFKVSGSFSANDQGLIDSGDFVIPIASIENFDLKDPVKKVLLDDLKSVNFFNLLLHPDAKFHLTKAEPFSTADTAAVADANYKLTGDFSMLGQTHSISFPAKISAAGDRIVTEAKFAIDRTKWGMGIYSDPSQKLYILPDVNIYLNIRSEASTPVSLAAPKSDLPTLIETTF